MAKQILLNRGLTSEIAPTNPDVVGLQNVMLSGTTLDEKDLHDLIKFSEGEVVIEGEPTADDTALWELAQQLAKVRGCNVKVKRAFAPGNPTVTLPWAIVGQQYANQPANRMMFNFIVCWDFEKGNWIKYYNAGSDNRGFVIMPRTGPIRGERIGTAQTTNAFRMQVQQQRGGLDSVFSLAGNEAYADNYAEGDWVIIATGVNRTDSDDPLCYRTMVAMVKSKNGTTGEVKLDRNISFPLHDDGFDGMTPATYGIGESASAGVPMFHNGELWLPLASGTTSAATPFGDGYHDAPTIDEAGAGYVQDEVTVIAFEEYNGDWINLGETFAVTVTAGAITAVTPTGNVGGYTSNCKFMVISDNDTATTTAELSPNILGVPFIKVSNDRVSVEADRNGAPIIQKILDPRANIVINGNGSLIEYVSEVQSPLAIRASADCEFKNFILKGRWEFPFGMAEGATNCGFKNIDALSGLEHTIGAANKSRVISCYNTIDCYIEDSKGVCGAAGTDARAIYLESGAQLRSKGNLYLNRYGEAINSYEFFAEGGQYSSQGDTFINFRQPYRYNTAAYNGFAPEKIDRNTPLKAKAWHISGNRHIGNSATQFRTPGDFYRHVFTEGEMYESLKDLFNSGGIQHPARVDFKTSYVSTLEFEFDVRSEDSGLSNRHPAYTGNAVSIGNTVFNWSDCYYIFLGQRLWWRSPPHSSRLTFRLILSDGAGSPTERSPFNNAINSNIDRYAYGREYNPAAPSDPAPSIGFPDREYNFSGTGIRLVDGSQEILQYAFLLQGKEGGTLRVMIDTLVMPYRI